MLILTIFSNSDNNNILKKNSENNNQLKGFKNQQQLIDFNTLDSNLKELLFTLKYHTNMMSIDKNFVLKNKKINEKLDKKIDDIKKQIQALTKKNYSDNEIHNQLVHEYTRTQSNYIILKYSNIFLFIIFVVLMSFSVLKNYK